MISVNYDDFNMNDINLPPRSKLYNLKPIGLGTPYVESLTSYISRLAGCHCINSTTLVCKTFIPYIKTESRKKSFMNGSLGPKIKYINGNSPISLEYVFALEELTTRNDLVYLTMNSWSGLFPNNVIGESRKWCPNCLVEAKNRGSEIYEPLIWYIKDIQLCDVHQVNLEDRCPKCGRKQNFLHANFIVGHCQYCMTWLGYESQTSNVDNLKYQEFLLDSFKSLIVNAQNLNTFPTNLRIGFVLKKIMDANNFSSINKFANFLGVESMSLSSWIRNKNKPSMGALFKIYNQTNLSIYEMFVNNYLNDEFYLNKKNPLIKQRRKLTMDEIENELNNEINDNYYSSLRKLCTAKGFNTSTAKKYFPDLCKEIDNDRKKIKKELEKQKREKIRRMLMLALDKQPPLSLNQFSNKFGISSNTAKYYCPELSKELINRHRSYMKKKQKIRVENIKSEIKQAVLELHNKGIYPSDKSLRRKLTNPNCLIKPEFRGIWKNELELLGYKK